MATARRSSAEWASWIAALLGLWLLVSPFALGAPPSGSVAFWSNVVVGVGVLVLAGYVAYNVRRVRRHL